MKKWLFIVLVGLSSCVGKKKFTELEQTKNALDNSLLLTRQDLAKSQQANVDYKNLNKILTDSIKRVQSTIDAIFSQTTKAQRELKQCQEEVKNLGKNKSELLKDLAAREARVKELETALAEREAKLKAIRQKVVDALTGISAADLTVEERNGRIYVSLSQKMLFKTGSSLVAKEGRDALVKLAAVLVQQSDLQVLVEGHTDSDGDDNINWKLSTDRSLAITYILAENQVPSQRMTAAGRGEFCPIAPNDSDEGKAKNRRTDIILSPNLESLWEILKN